MTFIIWTGIAATLSAIGAYLMKVYKIGSFGEEPEQVAPVPQKLVNTPPVSVPLPVQPLSDTITINSPSKIQRWAQAIGKWEGSNPKLHNPGNMKYSTLTASWGATKGPPASDEGFLCQFATDEQGETALLDFLTLGCEYQLIISHPKPCTVRQFTVKYAGNPPEGYILGVCQDAGMSPDTEIGTLLT